MKEKRSRALSKFRDAFPSVGKPTKELKIFKAVSTLSLDALSDLISLYTAWREYTDDLLIDAVCEKTFAKSDFDRAWDREILTMRDSTKHMKEAKVSQIQHIQELQEDLMEAELMVDFLSRKQASLEGSLSVLSREISRRGLKNYV